MSNFSISAFMRDSGAGRSVGTAGSFCRVLCGCLTGALGRPLSACDLPVQAADWEQVLRFSGVHLVTTQLRWALHRQGQLSEVPTDVTDYLEAVYALNLERNLACESQLEQLIAMLDSVGVQPVLLKGAAAIVGGLYPTAGERMISDLDILVPAEKLSDILANMRAAGYRPVEIGRELVENGEWQALSHHYPPLVGPGLPAAVELHLQPVDLAFVDLLPGDEVFRNAVTLRWRGKDCLIPSPDHFLAHNVIHSFLVNTQSKLERVSLRQLFEFVHASHCYLEKVAWAALWKRFDDRSYGSPLRQYLSLARDCFDFEPPAAIGIGAWNRLKSRIHLARLDLDRPSIEWAMNFLGQLTVRLEHLSRKPSLARKLLKTDFYTRWYDSVRR